MSAGLVDQQHGVGAGCDGFGDLGEMQALFVTRVCSLSRWRRAHPIRPRAAIVQSLWPSSPIV